ncbi:MAG: hypothetical protein NZ602_07280 [Thermoguttaceae bacterium]|nr:hypothetical protein [Thermoguttaceae bacterium]MDW8037617.1 hypothetical protein [Thermoguttaceae bacterium]
MNDPNLLPNAFGADHESGELEASLERLEGVLRRLRPRRPTPELQRRIAQAIQAAESSAAQECAPPVGQPLCPDELVTASMRLRLKRPQRQNTWKWLAQATSSRPLGWALAAAVGLLLALVGLWAFWPASKTPKAPLEVAKKPPAGAQSARLTPGKTPRSSLHSSNSQDIPKPPPTAKAGEHPPMSPLAGQHSQDSPLPPAPLQTEHRSFSQSLNGAGRLSALFSANPSHPTSELEKSQTFGTRENSERLGTAQKLERLGTGQKSQTLGTGEKSSTLGRGLVALQAASSSAKGGSGHFAQPLVEPEAPPPESVQPRLSPAEAEPFPRESRQPTKTVQPQPWTPEPKFPAIKTEPHPVATPSKPEKTKKPDWNIQQIVFVGQVHRAEGGAVLKSYPPGHMYDLTIEVLEVLRGQLKVGQQVDALHIVHQFEPPRYSLDKPSLVVAKRIPPDDPKLSILWIDVANPEVLREARTACGLPFGWRIENGQVVSPWADLGPKVWQGDTLGAKTVCAKSGRPALLAGDKILLKVEPVLPPNLDKVVNPRGDGEFKITVTNPTNEPITVPALLVKGDTILWANSLVILCGDHVEMEPYICPDIQLETGPLHSVRLQPGQSVSGTINILKLPGKSWVQGDHSVQLLFCLGERCAETWFAFSWPYHAKLREKLLSPR